jgi:hypothetical protein
VREVGHKGLGFVEMAAMPEIATAVIATRSTETPVGE